MKTKKYLHVTVTRSDNTTFVNELKLSEAHFISQLAQENKSLTVCLVLCDGSDYKLIFG